MTLEEYIKEQREKVANMTLAQARQIVASRYGHDDMRIECEKAVWMLLNCADEKINGGWIPVTERLPEESDDYLITNIAGDVEMAYFAHPKDYTISKGEWREICYEEDVVAWMPLPEPYNGGE